MRKQYLIALLLGMSSIAVAQGDSEPCCSVVGINNVSQHVIARDVKTGKLHQFKADKMDINAIKTNDRVSISNGVITSINAANRTYAKMRVTYSEPCCAVVSIQADPSELCCNIVTYSVKGSNQLAKFRAPKQITNTVRVGDPVYAEPVNKPNAVASVLSASPTLNNLAVIYSNDSDGLSAFGYPVESGDAGASDLTTNAMWKKWANNQKGVMGRYVFANLPKDAEWQIDIYREPDNKYIKTFNSEYAKETSIALAPASYTIKLMHAPVENVPVDKGNDTELKFGLLKVESEGQWDVYLGTKFLFTRHKPGKVVLPPGTYKMKLGSEEYVVVIKEDKTEEY